MSHPYRHMDPTPIAAAWFCPHCGREHDQDTYDYVWLSADKPLEICYYSERLGKPGVWGNAFVTKWESTKVSLIPQGLPQSEKKR